MAGTITARRAEWVSTKSGSAFVDPAAVVAVTDQPGGIVLHLIGGQSLILHDERTLTEITEVFFGPGSADLD